MRVSIVAIWTLKNNTMFSRRWGRDHFLKIMRMVHEGTLEHRQNWDMYEEQGSFDPMQGLW